MANVGAFESPWFKIVRNESGINWVRMMDREIVVVLPISRDSCLLRVNEGIYSPICDAVGDWETVISCAQRAVLSITGMVVESPTELLRTVLNPESREVCTIFYFDADEVGLVGDSLNPGLEWYPIDQLLSTSYMALQLSYYLLWSMQVWRPRNGGTQ